MALIVHALRSKRDRAQLGMGLSLLLLPYFPASGLLFRVGFVIAERYYNIIIIIIITIIIIIICLSVHCAIIIIQAFFFQTPFFFLLFCSFRVLYIPSVGYCIMVTIGIRRLHSAFRLDVSSVTVNLHACVYVCMYRLSG